MIQTLIEKDQTATRELQHRIERALALAIHNKKSIVLLVGSYKPALYVSSSYRSVKLLKTIFDSDVAPSHNTLITIVQACPCGGYRTNVDPELMDLDCTCSEQERLQYQTRLQTRLHDFGFTLIYHAFPDVSVEPLPMMIHIDSVLSSFPHRIERLPSLPIIDEKVYHFLKQQLSDQEIETRRPLAEMCAALYGHTRLKAEHFFGMSWMEEGKTQ